MLLPCMYGATQSKYTEVAGNARWGQRMSVDPRVSYQSDEELQQADAERYGKLMRNRLVGQVA
jgi:hypothetical protein